jgi:N-acetyl-anhydromuramyl-L-alanine amidase AmpD
MKIIQHPSNNSGARSGEWKIDTLVLHNTAGGWAGALATLSDPKKEVSAHYLVARSGNVYQLVPESRRAWHAGNRLVNDRSIGIEVEAYDAARGMTPPQEASLIELVRDVVQRNNIPTENIIPHRKVRATACPGFIWVTDKDFKKWVAGVFPKQELT